MSAPPSRRERRRLARRSDEVYAAAVARLRGAQFPLDLADLFVIAQPGVAALLHRCEASVTLLALGAYDLLGHIEAARPSRHPCDVPMLVIVDGYAAVSWLRAATMTAGGDA